MKPTKEEFYNKLNTFIKQNNTPLRKVCNFELQQIKQMNFGNREINQIHYNFYF